VKTDVLFVSVTGLIATEDIDDQAAATANSNNHILLQKCKTDHSLRLLLKLEGVGVFYQEGSHIGER
jgi:hypothetical protein